MIVRLTGILFITVGTVIQAQASKAPEVVRVATFACDVTPPLGHPLCGGWIMPLVGVDDPELAKGVVLCCADANYVLCVIDWCELRNDAYDLFRRRLAEAAGTIPSRVAVHCIHAHNAPITDRRAQELLENEKDAPLHADLEFLEKAAQNLLQDLDSHPRGGFPK